MQTPTRLAAVGANAFTLGLIAGLTLGLASCGDDSPPTPPIPVGACCVDDGCVILESTECFDRGVFLGSGSTCDPPACIPSGACCEAGECTLVLQGECTTPGVYQGDDTVCIPNPCPETGACCLDSQCAELSSDECAAQSGDYWGDGTRCAAEPDTLAGPNAGGVLLLHYAEDLTGTEAGRSCRFGISRCDEIVDQAPADASVLLAVFAAFPPSATPEVGSIRLGILHGMEVTNWAVCAPSEEITSNWPEPTSGLVASWGGPAQSELFFPVCWFEGYSEEGSFDLIDHPVLGPPGFADESVPPQFAPAAALGRLGFGSVPGRRLCPCR